MPAEWAFIARSPPPHSEVYCLVLIVVDSSAEGGIFAAQAYVSPNVQLLPRYK